MGEPGIVAKAPYVIIAGHLGTDEVVIGERPATRNLGGALWHFALGYCVLGSPAGVATWTDAETHWKARRILTGRGFDWSRVVEVESGPVFRMHYEENQPQVLKDITCSIPPMPDPAKLLADIQGRPVHICTMPFPDLAALANQAVATGASLVSVQFHESTIPTRQNWEETPSLHSAVVFCSGREFSMLTGVVLDDPVRLIQSGLPEGYDGATWVVTEPGWVAVVGHRERLWTAVAPVSRVVDVTGAGDVFAGGFLSLWLRGIRPEVAARFAGGLSAIKLGGFSSSALENLVRISN